MTCSVMSDLSLHCLLRPSPPNTQGEYSTHRHSSLCKVTGFGLIEVLALVKSN